MTNQTDGTRTPDPDETLLREALEAEARRIHPRTDWGDVVRRSHRRTPPMRVVALAAAALVVLGGGAALVAALDDRADEQDVVTEPAPPTTLPLTTTVPPPSTSAPPPGEEAAPTTTSTGPSTSTTMPTAAAAGPVAEQLGLPAATTGLPGDRYVAAALRPGVDLTQQELVVLSATTGEELATLATGFDTVEGGISGLALTPDRRTVLFVRGSSACTSDVLAAPTDGSAEPAIVTSPGDAVAVSRGGTVAVATGESCASPRSIEVTTADGEVRTFPLPADVGALGSLAFGGEDELLYVAWDREYTARTLHRLDLGTGGDEVLEPGPPGSVYDSVAPLPGGGASVLLTAPDGSTTLAVLAAGAIVEERPVEVEGAATAVLDAAGRLVAIAAREAAPVLHVDGEPRAEGVSAVTG